MGVRAFVGRRIRCPIGIGFHGARVCRVYRVRRVCWDRAVMSNKQ